MSRRLRSKNTQYYHYITSEVMAKFASLTDPNRYRKANEMEKLPHY